MPDRRDRSPAGPRILVCGWAGAGNIGDELLTRWIVERIEETGGVAVVSTRDPADTRLRHPSAVPIRWGVRDLGVVLRSIDGVIVGPGGIIQDSSSVWSLPGHLAKALVGRSRGLPIAGVGLGVQPLRRRSSRWLVRRTFGDASAVVVRDRGSSEALRAAGVASQVGIDVVFGLASARAEPASEIVVAVGPAVRPGRIAPAARRLMDDDKVALGAGLDALATRLEATIALTAFRGPRDRRFGEELRGLLHAPTRVVADEIDEHRSAVASARVVVTSRYHAAVLGLQAGTPVVVRSDEPKLRSLHAQIDSSGRLGMLTSWSDLGSAPISERSEGAAPPESIAVADRAVSGLVALAATR